MPSSFTSPRTDSSTFAPPPDGLSIPELYAFHAQHSPLHTAFTFTEGGSNRNITYAEAASGIHLAAEIVHANLPKPQREGESAVIAIAALSDTLSSVYLIIAIMSLGLTPFAISPQNTSFAITTLVKQTQAIQIYVSVDDKTQALIRKVCQNLSQDGFDVQVLPMFRFDNIPREIPWRGILNVVPVRDTAIQLILHSSGTTGFPKPIRFSRKGLLNIARIPCYGEMILVGKRIAVHTNPSFHALGLASILWPVTSGATFGVYTPQFPPVMPTPANFMSSWISDRCDVLFCVPVFIEAWAQDVANLPRLKALDAIVFSGSSLNKGIGNMLAKEGVVLHPFWGSTEIGPATMFIPREAPPTDEWEYFKLSPHAEYKMKAHPELQNIFEPIQLSTQSCFPHDINTEVDGNPAFACGDYLIQHPTDPLRWRVYGRKDDQIRLNTGDNINPVPIESLIVGDKHIAAVILVGHNRMMPAILVQPAKDYIFDPDDEAEKLSQFKNLIWPTLESVNKDLPIYSRIQKDMVVVVSPRKPLEYTYKVTPRRAVCLTLYGEEIEGIYQRQVQTSVNREFPNRG